MFVRRIEETQIARGGGGGGAAHHQPTTSSVRPGDRVKTRRVTSWDVSHSFCVYVGRVLPLTGNTRGQLPYVLDERPLSF